jgi:hypothetical protein
MFLRNRRLLYLLGLIMVLCLCSSCAASQAFQEIGKGNVAGGLALLLAGL